MILKTLFVIIIVIFLLLIKAHNYEVKYVVSNIDNEKYLVRELPDMQLAADMLARIKSDMITLSKYLSENKEKYKENLTYIDQLAQNIKPIVYSESSQDSMYTSYSVNKGEQIVFCLRSKTTAELHDYNLVMYVALHEISHVACPSYGHGDEFKKVFAFITQVAVSMNLYTKIDFANSPVMYCGISIADSII